MPAAPGVERKKASNWICEARGDADIGEDLHAIQLEERFGMSGNCHEISKSATRSKP
jgi:hypothetical protein